MTPKQALSILDGIARAHPASRAVHVQAVEAVCVLEALIASVQRPRGHKAAPSEMPAESEEPRPDPG